MPQGTIRQAAAAVPQSARPLTGYRLLFITCLACLPALLGRSLVAQVAALRFLASSHPYFQPAHAALLYFGMPLVAVSSFIFFLAPGICLVTAFGKTVGLLERILLAFGACLILSVVSEICSKLVPGAPLSADGYVVWWSAAVVAAASVAALRLHRDSAAPLQPLTRPETRRLVSMAVLGFVAVAVLTPKLFWENLNIDGTEAFEFGRSLGSHMLPYWDIQGGVFGFYHNFMLFAYPNHWFIALFGPLEGSVRLAFVFYLLLLFVALVLLIEEGFKRGLRVTEEAALWLGLALYTVLQGYNTTYDPFFADIAEPGATDTLLMVCFLAACYFMWTGRQRWFVVFSVATYLSTVGGSALLVGLAASLLAVRSTRKWGYLKTLAVVGGCCVLFGILHETIYNHLVLRGAKDQFSTRNMAARLYPPTITAFYRLAAVIFPSGILPAVSIFAITPADPITWSFGLITVLYTGIIYLQSWTALHQFTPAMVLPLVVFWRLYLAAGTRVRPWLLGGVVCTTGLALVLSLPRNFEINTSASEFGAATDFRVGDYGAQYQTAVEAAGKTLGFLLPADYRLRYPHQPWGLDDESWVYYAFHKAAPTAPANYIVQRESDAAPKDATLAGQKDGFAVYVRDPPLWQRQRNQKLPQVIQSPLYEPILRHTCEFYRAYVARMQHKQPGN